MPLIEKEDLDAILEAFGDEAEFNFGIIKIIIWADQKYLDSQATPYDLIGYDLIAQIKHSDVIENIIEPEMEFIIENSLELIWYKINSTALKSNNGWDYYPIILVSRETI